MSTISGTTSAANPYIVAYSSSDISGTDSTASKYTQSSNNSNKSSSSSGTYSQSLVGQMTGLDVTNMVNESMQSDVVKLNNLLSKQQISQWKQDRYRSIITNLQSFNSKYFDVLSPDYILSDSAFSVNSAASSNANVMNASALNNAKTGAYTITSAQLATAAKITSDSLKNTTGAKPAASDAISSMGITSGTISFVVNGKTSTYTLDSSSKIGDVMNDLTSMSGLNFNYSELTGKFSISTQKTGNGQNVEMTSVSDSSNFFSKLGITVNGSRISTAAGNAVAKNTSTGNVASASDTISATNLQVVNGKMTFNINGVDESYSVDSSKTISQVMSDLSSASGKSFSYDATTGKINVTTNGNITDVTQTSNNSTGHNGTFAIQEPGEASPISISKASNNFTLDGVSYSFSSSFDSTKAINPDSPVTINVSSDVDSVTDKIKSFVDDYNNLIDGIDTVVTEKKDLDYKPLSSSQESDMTASQITSWNQKAQQGILSNDSNLTSMLSEMREAFYMPVSGNSLTMGGIGLSTSDDVTQGGKITLNLKTLKTALQNNPQQVVDLFTKTSSSYATYEGALDTDATQNSGSVNKAVSQRNKEEGIFQRLSDIEKKYAGNYVDKNGNQGILLMTAGMPNTVSETKSTLYKQLKDQAQAVKDFKTKMTSDATMYNKKFSNLQSILSQLSSQQSALSSMLGTNSSS